MRVTTAPTKVWVLCRADRGSPQIFTLELSHGDNQSRGESVHSGGGHGTAETQPERRPGAGIQRGHSVPALPMNSGPKRQISGVSGAESPTKKDRFLICRVRGSSVEDRRGTQDGECALWLDHRVPLRRPNRA